MSADLYSTIVSSSEGVFKDRGSKFLSYAIPISSISESEHNLLDITKNHPSARHYCWAYKLGYYGENYRVNDDGEPNNSAGKPIFGQIEAFGLTQILIVVVRYFGGTLLGVGGLIQAYKEAAKQALLSAKIVELPVPCTISITCDYTNLPYIMKLISQEHCSIVSESYDVDCVIRCSVPKYIAKEIYAVSESYSTISVQYYE